MSSERFIPAQPFAEEADLLRQFVDLAHPRLGTEVTFATDDFFADKARMIAPEPPVFYPDRFDDNGKWMDGWESRRKREPGHDHAIVKLGQRGRISAIDIDTAFFTGNFPPEAMVEIADTPGEPGADDWTTIVAKRSLAGDSHNLVRLDAPVTGRWLKLHIFPDGGVARLRVYGQVEKDWSEIGADETVDLAALVNGGSAIAWNDAHYGSPANMLAPGTAPVMADGWETARRRQPGNDWCVIKLGTPGMIERILVDTKHFKGNYPDRFTLRGAKLSENPVTSEIEALSQLWPELVTSTKLQADTELEIERADIERHGAISHVRLDIFPDGGVSRLRLFGKKSS